MRLFFIVYCSVPGAHVAPHLTLTIPLFPGEETEGKGNESLAQGHNADTCWCLDSKPGQWHTGQAHLQITFPHYFGLFTSLSENIYINN